jgi:hypothetical protein
MRSIIWSLTLIHNFLEFATATQKAKVMQTEVDGLVLKLDYATYRGNYDKDNEVPARGSRTMIYAYTPVGIHI